MSTRLLISICSALNVFAARGSFAAASTVLVAPRPGVYLGADRVRVIVQELTWLKSRRVFRFDFTDGSEVRATTMVDVSADDPRAVHSRLPHEAPTFIAPDAHGQWFLKWTGVPVRKFGSCNVEVEFDADGGVHFVSCRLSRYEGDRLRTYGLRPRPRALLWCEVALDHRLSRALRAGN